MDSFFSEFVLSDQLRYRLARHIFFWLACWGFMGFIYGFTHVNDAIHLKYFHYSYIESAFFLPQHMLLSYGIIYFVLPRYIFRNRYWKGLGFILLLIIITAFLSPVTQKFFLSPIRESLGQNTWRVPIFYSFMGGLRGGMTIAGFAAAIKLVKHWYFKKVENQVLEKEKLKAELQVLKGQLHPHFIFNTLNSIYSLSLKGSDQISPAILKLSEMMRYILTEGSAQTIPLAKEIGMLYNYIDLEKNRLCDRIDMALNVTGEFDGKHIAPLIFLPFLENSFKYGAHEIAGQAWISLDLAVTGDQLRFKLINGKPTENGTRTSSGIGLQNVRKRLQMLYPGAHELRIKEDSETFRVHLQIRLDKIRLPEPDEKVELPFSG